MGKRETEQLDQRHWYRRSDRGARGPLMAFMPFATLFLCQMVMLQSMPKAWVWMMDHPWAAVVTYLALLLVEMAVERLSTSLLAGGVVIFLPCFLLAVASYLKLITNGVPLLFSDLAMIGQAAEITGFLNPEIGIGGATWGAIFLALGVLFLMFLWDRPIRKMVWWKRILMGVGALVAVVVLFALPATGALMDDQEEGEVQALRNERLGVLAGMYAAARQNFLVEPDAYTEENMNRILLQVGADAPRVRTPEEKPNVILLMSESFFDPTRLPNVEYSEDPVPNYHALAEEFPAGPFLTNTYAGGTGNVEMEIMSGVSVMLLSGEETLTTIEAPGAYERIPSIVKAFASQGYLTTYVHSHDDSYFERESHIPAIGFQQIYYKEDFRTELESEGYYVSDDCWADEIIYRFKQKEEGQPIFLYGLSMENHQPFASNKFAEPGEVEVATDRLEGEQLGMLDSLIHGLHDADAALGKLIDYFSRVKEPTILVFVGDHLPRPSFADGTALYDRLGYSTSPDTLTWSADELKYMLSTNYLVWNNYDADLDVPETLSSTGLGTKILGWAGMPKPLYFTWIDTVLEDMLMYRPRLYVAGDGEATHTIPKQYEATMKRYRTIVYDILYGQQFAAEAFTGSRVRQTVVDTMPDVVAPPPMEEE